MNEIKDSLEKLNPINPLNYEEYTLLVGMPCYCTVLGQDFHGIIK